MNWDQEAAERFTDNELARAHTVEVTMLWKGRKVRRAVQIDRYVGRCFEPLHKDHDFPGMLDARADAWRQREERRRLAADVARTLTAALLEAVEAEDPRKGYSAKENREWERLKEETE
jgi:hypothetical protein